MFLVLSCSTKEIEIESKETVQKLTFGDISNIKVIQIILLFKSQIMYTPEYFSREQKQDPNLGR